MSKNKSLTKKTKGKLESNEEVPIKKQTELEKLRGNIQWDGDLDEMRTDSEQLQNWYDSQFERTNY